MRTQDGVIHLVDAAQSVDFKGILRCGLLFSSPIKGRTKWIPRSRPGIGNVSVVAVRTSKRATCLWCVTGRKQWP